MDDLKNLEKELIERLISLETRLDGFIEANNQVLKEVKETLKKLNDLSHGYESRISKLEVEMKWFAKIPIVILLGLNAIMGALHLIKMLGG